MLRRTRAAARDPSLAADHSPDAVRHRLSTPPSTSYLRDFIYGAIDGAVTTFAFAVGALLESIV